MLRTYSEHNRATYVGKPKGDNTWTVVLENGVNGRESLRAEICIRSTPNPRTVGSIDVHYGGQSSSYVITRKHFSGKWSLFQVGDALQLHTPIATACRRSMIKRCYSLMCGDKQYRLFACSAVGFRFAVQRMECIGDDCFTPLVVGQFQPTRLVLPYYNVVFNDETPPQLVAFMYWLILWNRKQSNGSV